MLGAGVRGRSREMIWDGRWEGGSGLGTHVHPWLIHVNVWQNQYSIAKQNKVKIKIKKEVFSIFCVFFKMCYLCEKYYKPVRVLYYTADCVGWTLRLNLLDLGTNWT